MKILQGKAVAIIQTIGNISKQAIPLEAARELFRMKKALMSAQEFQYEQQEKYVQECNAHMRTCADQMRQTGSQRRGSGNPRRRDRVYLIDNDILREVFFLWLHKQII